MNTAMDNNAKEDTRLYYFMHSNGELLYLKGTHSERLQFQYLARKLLIPSNRSEKSIKSTHGYIDIADVLEYML